MSPFSLSALDLVSFLPEIVFHAVKLGVSLVNRRKGLTLLLFFKAFTLYLSLFFCQEVGKSFRIRKDKKSLGNNVNVSFVSDREEQKAIGCVSCVALTLC